jgi:hypothetical protein
MTSLADKLAKKGARPVPTKQVRLKLVYVDFWSAVKLSFLVTVALGIVLIVATFLIWMVLAQTGIFDKVNQLFIDVSGDSGFDLNDVISLGQVMGFALVIAVLNIVVGTALGAVTSLLYNLSVRITGGLLVGFTNE